MSDQDPVEAFTSWLNEKRDVLKKLLDDGSWYDGGYLRRLLAEAQCEAIGLGLLDVYEAIGNPPPFAGTTSDFDFMRRQHEFTLARFDAALWAVTTPPPPEDPFLSYRELASRFGLTPGAANKRLKRWREKNLDGWVQDENRNHQNAPQFLYKLSAVTAVLKSP